MSTSPPLSYFRSCVPLALSTLTGYSLDMIARTLWAGGAARRMGVAGGVQLGTDTIAALDLMSWKFGVRTELAIPRGVFNAEQTAAWIAQRMHEGVVEVRRERAVDRASEGGEGGADEQDPVAPTPPKKGEDIVTVATWPHEGHWMLEVNVDGTGHAIGLIDGTIVAGGEKYRGHRVTCGWHIIN